MGQIEESPAERKGKSCSQLLLNAKLEGKERKRKIGAEKNAEVGKSFASGIYFVLAVAVLFDSCRKFNKLLQNSRVHCQSLFLLRKFLSSYIIYTLNI